MASVRGLRRLLLVLPVVAVAACSGVGKGDKIESMRMVAYAGATPVVLEEGSDHPAYQCVRQQLSAFAVFGKNGTGDYTARPATVWTSSAPDVVTVSNGDQVDPSDATRVFGKGVITVLAPGEATITADYFGVKTSVVIKAAALNSIVISTSPFDSTVVAAPITIATGSKQQYYAYARMTNLDGVEVVQDVTGNATWSIPDDVPKAIASMFVPAAGSTVGSGVVTAVAPGGPVTIQADFKACPADSTYVTNPPQAELSVDGIDFLTLEHGADYDGTNPLVVTTSAAYKVTATLLNGDTQDLSFQSQLGLSVPVVAPATSILAFVSNIVIANAVGTTDIVATFKSGTLAEGEEDDDVVSAPLSVSTQAATLTAYAIGAGEKNKTIPIQGFYDHYHAVGTFTPTLGGDAFTQDLTANTAWTSSDSTVVSIGNGFGTQGLAVSQKPEAGCVTITARYGLDTTKTFTTLLSVGDVLAPDATACPTVVVP